jgi:hypothetical protein
MMRMVTTQRRAPADSQPDPERARTWLRAVMVPTLALTVAQRQLIRPGWPLGCPNQPGNLDRPVGLAS